MPQVAGKKWRILGGLCPAVDYNGLTMTIMMIFYFFIF